MEQLYNELWGKGRQKPAIEDFHVAIPQVRYTSHPGYGITIEQAYTEGFPPPEFRRHAEGQKFKVLRTKAKLPCDRRTLLIRSEYEIIEKDIGRVFSAKWPTGIDSPVQETHQDYLVTGQTGSGKTFFLSYLLAIRLLCGQPTVYRDDDQRCFLFTRESGGKQIDSATLFTLGADAQRKLWILTDEPLTGSRWKRHLYKWFIVLAAAPLKTEASSDWLSNRNPAQHFIDNWEWAELFAAFSLRKMKAPTQTEISRIYTTFVFLSPVARTCLQTVLLGNDTSYTRSLRRLLSGIKEAINDLVNQEVHLDLTNSITSKTSQMITIIEPLDGGSSYTYQIATRWIAFCIYTQGQKASQLKFYELYKHLSRQQPLRTAAGWFFEGYVHDWFRQGGHFTAHELTRARKSSVLQFEILRKQSSSLNYFTTPDDLAKQVRAESRRGISTSVLGKYFLQRE